MRPGDVLHGLLPEVVPRSAPCLRLFRSHRAAILLGLPLLRATAHAMQTETRTDAMKQNQTDRTKLTEAAATILRADFPDRARPC